MSGLKARVLFVPFWVYRESFSKTLRSQQQSLNFLEVLIDAVEPVFDIGVVLSERSRQSGKSSFDILIVSIQELHHIFAGVDLEPMPLGEGVGAQCSGEKAHCA